MQNLLNELKLVLATFQIVMTFQSKTNNRLTNIRFAAGTKEAESLNEKYSFWINLCGRGRVAHLVKKFTSCRELQTLKAPDNSFGT